ncbi:MAG: DHH family phosphoesterase, partial [Oscillospiraceae bacterium]
ETVLKSKKDIFGYNIENIVSKDVKTLLANQGSVISYDGCNFEVYCIENKGHTNIMYVMYLVDITELYNIKLEAEKTKPVVMLFLVDNYDESIGNENESNKVRLVSEVQRIIQNFVDKTNGFIKKIEHDKYLIMIENQSLEGIIAGRFDVLDKTREITTEGRIPVTLSIGVASVETTLVKAEQDARQALDMALGRGGDQAAVKADGGYEFFGGFSKGVEKRTKVKTRIVASAMVELIKSAGNVLVMGHKFADLDSLGSAIGIAKACECFGKSVNIVLDTRRNLAGCLVKRMVENNRQNLICLPEIVMDKITDKTLLIIVDTHSEMLIESPQIYKKCKQVVVIDHHRKMVNHIDDAVIFYHEPYASSASEMVTELVQYFGDNCKLSNVEAEALLSGIMLDTRNFVIKTGVRTFEAAAYLRRLGADTVEVRKLFASTMDSYQRKTRVVASAEIYKECAISSCDFTSDDIRIVAPQSADELLNISGVKASFVLYEENDTINVSARSMGALNVQVIMEKLGGGGHHTMAAAQIPNATLDKVRQSLLEIIDRQIELMEKS